ncbi:MAG: hypothetical protein ACXVB0_14075 [Mucilaginibacter sp.]
MEPFMNLPWWAQVVFVATNAFVVFILVMLVRQAVIGIRSHNVHLIVKKKLNEAGERKNEYGSERSGNYIDA